MMPFETLERLCVDILTLIRATREIPSLTQRLGALEARMGNGGTESCPLYTANPATWPPREARNGASAPPRGRKEYNSDEIDLEIAKAILRLAPDSWDTLRVEMARVRRLTTQQVAELKARITRLKLLAA